MFVKEIDINRELTKEELQMLEAAEAMPIVYDEDSPELSDEERDEMDLRFRILEVHFKEDPFVRIKYFVPDAKKEGGKVVDREFEIHQIDTVNEVVIATDRKRYDMNLILNIDGSVINKYRNSGR